MSGRVLVADDERLLRASLCEYLADSGYEVEGVADGQAALERLDARDYDVLLTDLRMPRLDGMTLLRRVAERHPQTSALVMTAYASVETAVEALRLGAFDYVLKPIVFADLGQKIEKLLQVSELRGEVQRLRRQVHADRAFEGIVGQSDAIRTVFEQVERVGPTDTTVLITGESGTGKELVARALHARSALADKPFLPVNVAAIPADMLASQLFGHVKGAFTGATRDRDGLLRVARGGTVFLDEIGEIPLGQQAKLLRAIESHEVLPVGADRPMKVRFRLLGATNRALEEAVAQGRFRADLFYRLNVFRVSLPALRDRAEDVAPLAHHFLRVHSQRMGRARSAIDNATMRLLTAYDWPGNVRELSNVVERAVILSSDGPIGVAHLPAELHARQKGPISLKDAVAAAEAAHIRRTLAAAGGDKEEAAALLRVDRATLYRRLKKHGIG